MNKKVLITGGSGFIGTNLIKKFNKKKIIIISKNNKNSIDKNLIYVKCDLKSKSKVYNLFKKVKPDLVYHLAWEGIPKFNNVNFEKNKTITKNIIFAANNTKCKKIIVAGSCMEYNYHTIKKTFSEKSNVKCLSKLGKQKKKIYKIFKKSLNKDLIFIWARIFYVYGHGQRKGSLLHSIIECQKKNKIFKLENGSINNDFIYIDDVVSALYLLQKMRESHIINISTSISTSNIDFINIYKKLSKLNENLLRPRFHKKKYLIGSNQKLKLFGWKPKYNLISGINKTIKKYNSGR